MFYDAHNHLQASELSGLDFGSYWQIVRQVAVNGTHPRDWEAVAELADEHPSQALPQFGVHPWYSSDLPDDWDTTLYTYLQRYPQAGIGEIGLDKWMKNHDLAKQKVVLQQQIEIANELQRPLSVHCIQAWGSLRTELATCTTPFLLHAYAGPAEWIPEFVARGAYFSLSPYYFHERKRSTLEAFKQIPSERLLIESDAPSMLGPKKTWSTEQNEFSTTHQHPANLIETYRAAEDFLQNPNLQDQCARNFLALFGYEKS